MGKKKVMERDPSKCELCGGHMVGDEDAGGNYTPFAECTNTDELWHKRLRSVDHSNHGRGSDGPDDHDCPCRTTKVRAACAQAGCGFCLSVPPEP
jgi:hypothetical protein